MPFEYKSIMIEVNKNVYMNEETLSLSMTKWTRCRNCIERIYDELLTQ